MSLITQKKPNLAGGVNQQGAVHRHSTQVEEMVNCVPTLNEGTRLRNPTAPIPVYDLNGVLSEVTFPTGIAGAFVYEHDRGSLSGRDSELSFIITENGGLEIIDLTLKQEEDSSGQELLAGTIYKDGAGINYANQEARDYIRRFIGRNSYAMTTVKDTTFVVNKSVSPKMTPTKQDLANPTVDYGNVTVDYNSIGGLNPDTVTGASGTFVFTPPINVTEVTPCMCGGGGSGATNDYDQAGVRSGGGNAGAILNDKIPVTAGTPYDITVGTGGSSVSGGNNNGIAGTDSSFDTHVAAGGLGGVYASSDNPAFNGNNESRVSCGGTYKNGDKHDVNVANASGGGQAGAFGNGGDAGDYDPGQAGGIGAGGGAVTWSSGGGEPSGVGGNGKVNLSWVTITAESTNYLRSGYVWIKSASVVTSGYSYGCTIKILDSDGVPETIDVASTTPNLDGTISGATALAANINTALGARGNATQAGSMIQVTLNEPVDGKFEQIRTIESNDTFGDTASFGWGHNVDTMADLPKSMADFLPVVEVGSESKSTYWLHYKEGVWKEHRDPDIYTQIDSFTMPHTITKKLNEVTGKLEFYVEQYEWENRLVGDDSTNKIPSFVTEFDNNNQTYIKDIFFFRNRLGFITKDSIIVSEVGEYGNFFRTSVAALLDGDRIDANIEAFNAVNLEYAILLEDSVMLFADKAQFRFSGGDVLSPAAYKIQQELAYDVNTAVRPLFMNDRIFFVAERGNHSAIYEMIISNNSNQDSQANDLTAHCQTYVDGNIERLTGSAVNNMLFLTSREGYTFTDGSYSRNTVFVYKYHEEGRQKQQSAWSKWTFDGDIISGFAISKNFYLMIDRNDAISEEDWILGTGQWLMNKPWKMDGSWIMSSESFEKFKQFERLAIQPKLEGGIFLDNRSTPIDGLIDLGEWVYGKDGNKDERGTLQMKTVEVTASDISTLKLTVTDTQRRTYREILDKQRRGRKPMVYGRSDRIRVGIRNEGDRGFRIEMVSFEGNINKRAKSH